MKMPDDSTVRLIDLPVECDGMVSLSPDGHFNIYLNARLDHETQRKKFQHEVAHIENDDFFNDDPIEVVEARADGLPAPLKSIPRLIRARDLIPPSPSLPDQKEEAPSSPPTEEDASSVPIRRPSLSPHQATVLLHAISDLDAWLFRDSTYEL